MSSDQLLELLDAEGIEHHTVDHPPMWTVEDAKALRVPSNFGHTKNLFVRNKKGQMWLLTLHEDRQIDLKTAAKLVGTNRFSFASPQRLMHYLGVVPGAVSAFSMLNDVNREVKFFIDEALMKDPKLHVHPLINTRTTTLDRLEMLKFLRDKGYPHQVLEFPKAGLQEI